MIGTSHKPVLKKTGGVYPAPLAALEVVKEGLLKGRAGLNREAVSFGKLGLAPQSKSLVSLLLGQTALKEKKNPRLGRTAKASTRTLPSLAPV